MRKTNKKSIKIITRSSNITFASEREELYEPLNIISTAVNFWMVVKKMVLKLLSPTCVNKVFSQWCLQEFEQIITKSEA